VFLSERLFYTQIYLSADSYGRTYNVNNQYFKKNKEKFHNWNYIQTPILRPICLQPEPQPYISDNITIIELLINQKKTIMDKDNYSSVLLPGQCLVPDAVVATKRIPNKHTQTTKIQNYYKIFGFHSKFLIRFLDSIPPLLFSEATISSRQSPGGISPSGRRRAKRDRASWRATGHDCRTTDGGRRRQRRRRRRIWQVTQACHVWR